LEKGEAFAAFCSLRAEKSQPCTCLTRDTPFGIQAWPLENGLYGFAVKNIPLNERIIFALDFSDPKEAARWVEKLDSHVKFFKVGLQLFLAGWWPVIDHIRGRGNKVMVDLKFFDIPETVHLAMRQLKDKGATFATVHGNQPIIEAAVAAKNDIKVLAVTVLTSFDESDMREMGFIGSVQDLVLIRSRKALRLGCDGIVSSAREAKALRDEFGSNFLVVTPGIRPGLNRDVEKDDQKRIATARQAILNGADHVVVGRPISTSPDPLYTISTLQAEIAEGLRI
jgi:orotidine-5'-phosphate decarboxylase